MQPTCDTRSQDAPVQHTSRCKANVFKRACLPVVAPFPQQFCYHLHSFPPCSCCLFASISSFRQGCFTLSSATSTVIPAAKLISQPLTKLYSLACNHICAYLGICPLVIHLSSPNDDPPRQQHKQHRSSNTSNSNSNYPSSTKPVTFLLHFHAHG